VFYVNFIDVEMDLDTVCFQSDHFWLDILWVESTREKLNAYCTVLVLPAN
jgi:hypothetical protein